MDNLQQGINALNVDVTTEPADNVSKSTDKIWLNSVVSVRLISSSVIRWIRPMSPQSTLIIH